MSLMKVSGSGSIVRLLLGEVQWVGQIDNETGKVRIWDLI